MKKLLAALAALIGLPGASASEVKMVDPKTLLYSLATISDELPALDPQHKAKEGRAEGVKFCTLHSPEKRRNGTDLSTHGKTDLNDLWIVAGGG